MQHFSDQYQKGICKSTDYTAQITEVIPENTAAAVSQKKNNELILRHRTVFRYGIGDKIGEEHQRDTDIPTGATFESLEKLKNIKKDQRIRPLVKKIQLKTFFIYIRNI